ncbi:MAG: zinc-dependent peptidase [Saprospirales bacterium]|nr:zinc-dependent peptidase [Saprospirales bacterium]
MSWKWLAIPLVILALVFLYLTWEVDEKYALYIIPSVVALVILFVFGPQIDWWLARRKTPELDPKIRHLLTQRSPYYNNLSAEQKQRLRDRIVLVSMALDFKPQAMETVPDDIIAILGFYAAQITLGFEQFLLTPFENIVLYPGPFPSPQFPEHWHASETFEEDGVLLFSLDHLMKGFLNPLQYYPVGLHEMAQAFLLKYPEKDYPVLDEATWEDIRKISGIGKEKLTKYMGLPRLPILPVCIVYFFTIPQRFKAVSPGLYTSLVQLFQQDPAHA